MRLACIFIATLCTMPQSFEGQNAASVLSFLAAGIPSCFICPQKFGALLYTALLGHYVLFKIYIDRRVLRRTFRLMIKGGYFLLWFFALVLIAKLLGVLPAQIAHFLKAPLVYAALPAATLLWFILEAAYDSALSLYNAHLRKYLFTWCQ